MKKVLLVLVLLFIGTLWFVSNMFSWHWTSRGRNISIRVKETTRTYELKASYARNKTYRIQKFVDDELHTNDLFSHGEIDGTIRLDDQTNFYAYTAPGRLTIRMNKRENDPAAYIRLKSLGEKLKRKLTED